MAETGVLLSKTRKRQVLVVPMRLSDGSGMVETYQAEIKQGEKWYRQAAIRLTHRGSSSRLARPGGPLKMRRSRLSG